MKVLRDIAWLLRALLFVALLLFALKNTEPVTLRLYLDQTWQAPLVLVVLVLFAVGAVLRILAWLSQLLAQRRENLALKRRLQDQATAESSPVPPILGA